MAQAGFTPIQLYYSNTSGNAPAALANGEIALNQADGKLYYKTSTGVIRVLAASEVEVQVYNNTGSTIPQGSVVYLSGGATGQTPHISLAIATSVAASNILGLTVAAISTGTAGYVTTIGLSATLNTAAFTNGDTLYLSSSVAGALTATAPTSPNYAVRVGFVSYANATGRIFITMANQYVPVSSIVGTIAPTQGGTGLTTYTTGDILYASASNVLSNLPAGSNGQILNLSSGVPAWTAPTSFQTSLSGLTPSTSTTGTVTLAGTLGAVSGGTGLTSYSTGDLIYASSATTLAKLGAGSSNLVLTSNGAGVAPSWQIAPVTAGVSTVSFGSTGLTPATATAGSVTVAGTLVAANGGTGIASYAQGEMLYANTTTTLDKVTANTTVTKKFLSQTGNGTAGLAPSFDQPAATDITGLAPSATTDTTNASNITSGTLGVSVGGTGQTTYTDGQLLIGNSTGSTLAKSTLTAGSGITITNGSGSITIAASGGGGGTVTSVTGTSPVASSGGATPDISLSAGYGDTLNPYASKTANFVLAAPDSTAGVPTFRAVVAADIPTLNQNTTGTAANVTGVVANTNGGTGQSSAFTQYGVTYASTTTALATTSAGTTTTVLHGNASGAPTFGAVSLTADVTGVLPVANGGTGVTASTGTGSVVLSTSPSLTTPALGTPASGNLANCTFPTLNQNTTGTAAGLSTTLAVTSGGTGQTSYTNGQLLIGNSTGNTLTKSTLTAGSGITITNGSGAITIAASGGGGVTGFTAALNVASPNATNNVSSLTASGGTTNQYAALVAKGNAGVLANIPDNSATGGNVRGQYSADFQLVRSAGNQVASGTYSALIGGADNKATNSAAGIVAGTGNSVSSIKGGILAGDANTISGNCSVALGGTSGTDRGAQNAVVTGSNGSTSTGSNQTRTIVLMAETTNATLTVATANNLTASTTNQLNLEDGTAFAFRAQIVATVKTSGGNMKVWTVVGAIKRGAGAGTTAIVGTPTVTSDAADAGASTWTVTATADTTNGALSINCTGQAATNIRWNCVVTSSEAIAS
jgi:hypothetical protein